MVWILNYFLIIAYGLEFHTFPITDSPPNPRKGLIMDAIPSHNSMVGFGGYENRESIYSDIWQFNVTSNTWNALFGTNNYSPDGRYCGGGFYRYKSEEYCIWGGRSSKGVLNDIWCFHLRYFTWREIEINGNTIVNSRYKIGYTSWNETGITMFAVFGGISTDALSRDLFM
ncbi:unnamed protein product [Blepharisma stoltei]|uniref:Uncharacterized protein n=1 Tax=Blepharisma stoltei TaxID=1481888 RepID=A0AAU9IY80_9CILI|nr:unnamed protein product [Blepharisma stoltei]